jgi:hypothetical protein
VRVNIVESIISVPLIKVDEFNGVTAHCFESWCNNFSSMTDQS